MAWANIARVGPAKHNGALDSSWHLALPVGRQESNHDIGPGTRKNYVANFGGPANFMAWSGVLVPLKDTPPLSYAGVYSNGNSGTTFGIEGITDGSSNTAMFSETLLGSGPLVADLTGRDDSDQHLSVVCAVPNF